ncbi:hypothetical protein Pdw03_2620 [Penicillium digitatum]|uniref:Uncharacterized protein n=3 Tax=Penicillium digitatum TaxID=36651 RepID=K9GR88_PEND2|nr:hypothetical protein PDIP_88310 [Penicillium digitatum Pd1]EKV04323.1 hypothetical protein PDIP_88310 [Penicillium digitatum Pd1]EKV17193.1 hypothetical protein PDIG_16800 [Penicillium digitatum PHI26]KAG0153160.1 hypothetical protein PDIDSM_5010 [Penicillium digitatum]QQK39766.1 hypothetical protein Pdw03_2620 [Penicillium digitatum]
MKYTSIAAMRIMGCTLALPHGPPPFTGSPGYAPAPSNKRQSPTGVPPSGFPNGIPSGFPTDFPAPTGLPFNMHQFDWGHFHREPPFNGPPSSFLTPTGTPSSELHAPTGIPGGFEKHQFPANLPFSIPFSKLHVASTGLPAPTRPPPSASPQ